MNCKKIQELILTDYFDEELSSELRLALDSHLSDCKECGEFAVRVKAGCDDSLGDRAMLNAPDYLWYRIKEKVIKEKPARAHMNIFGIFALIPKPVYAVFIIAVLVGGNLAAYLWISGKKGPVVYAGRTLTLSGYLDEGSNGDQIDESIEFGTDIERVFL